MLTAGGLCVIVLGWVLILAFMRGVGAVGVIIAIVASAVVGFGAGISGPAETVISSVAPALNAIGGG